MMFHGCTTAEFIARAKYYAVEGKCLQYTVAIPPIAFALDVAQFLQLITQCLEFRAVIVTYTGDLMML
jgi:hypothetical protein